MKSPKFIDIFPYYTKQIMFIIESSESKGSKSHFYSHHLDLITLNTLVSATD